MRLTLPLLMLWLEFIDNVNAALAADDFVVGADFLDTSTHFHSVRVLLLCGLRRIHACADTLLRLIM